MQSLHEGDHGLGDVLPGVRPATLLQATLQIIHVGLAGDVESVAYVEIVGGEESGDPVLNDPIDDLVELILRIARMLLLQRLKPFLSEFDVVSAGSLS